MLRDTSLVDLRPVPGSPAVTAGMSQAEIDALAGVGRFSLPLFDLEGNPRNMSAPVVGAYALDAVRPFDPEPLTLWIGPVPCAVPPPFCPGANITDQPIIPGATENAALCNPKTYAQIYRSCSSLSP